MTASNLAGKVVCITGASRGLGAAMARAFADEGCQVVLAARSKDQLDELASELRRRYDATCTVVQTDVREPAQLQALVDRAVAVHGRLDIMINNAGLAIYGQVDTITPDGFDTMWRTNVTSVIFGSQAALAAMKPQGSGLIINISSIAGKLHLFGESAYNATKWAVNGFTGTLRLEAEKHGVRVSCVCPGGIDTPFWEGMEHYPFPTDRISPERDFMSADEVAASVVHVAQGSDRYVMPEVVMQPLIR